MIIYTDLVVGPGEQPGLVFDGTVGEAFDYALDQEITGNIYRAINAEYSTAGWSQKDSSVPAFALIQYGEDGSLGHLAQSASEPPFWTGGGQRCVYDVRDFGAIGDGVTDDTTAINNAAAAVGSGGGIVYLPTGRYLISKVIRLQSNTTLLGDGPQASILAAAAAINGPAVDGHTDTSMVANYNYDSDDAGDMPVAWNIYVIDIGLYGNGNFNFPPIGTDIIVNNGLITLKQVQNQGVYRCTIQSSSNHGIDIQGYGSAPWNTRVVGNFRIVECIIDLLSDVTVPEGQNSGFPIRGEGIDAGFIGQNLIGYGNLAVGDFPNGQHTNDAMDFPGCWQVVITGNQITNCVDGIGTNSGGDLTITDNLVEQNYGFGIAAFAPTGGSDNGSFSVVISRNVVDQSVRAAVFLEPYAGDSAPANIIVANNQVVSGGSQWSIDIDCRGVLCYGNSIDLMNNANSGGIHISDSEVTAECNTVFNAHSDTSTGVEIDFGTGSVELNGIRITRNMLIGVAAPIAASGGPLLGLVGSVVRKNLGALPIGAIASTSPSSDSPVTNMGPFDCRVAVTGGSNFEVLLGGTQVSTTKVAATKDAMYFLPVGMTIEIKQTSGHDFPSWQWFAI
jgi:hypothetical protein